MGLWASIESAHANGLGLASYDFYNQYNRTNPARTINAPTGPVFVANKSPRPVKGFRDITLGTNAGCVAKAGYDYCTGIGALLAGALSGQLAGGQTAAGHGGATQGQGSGGKSTSGQGKSGSGHGKSKNRGGHRAKRHRKSRSSRHKHRGFTG
jgi:hypothetical protein